MGWNSNVAEILLIGFDKLFYLNQITPSMIY